MNPPPDCPWAVTFEMLTPVIRRLLCEREIAPASPSDWQWLMLPPCQAYSHICIYIYVRIFIRTVIRVYMHAHCIYIRFRAHTL